MKILIVEDDSKIASFISKGLTQAGFTVDLRENAEESLALAEDSLYDLMIVDIMLPGMDGIEFIETLRGKGYNIPILILSARQSVNDKVRGLKHGGDDYLTKPFSFTELLARVQALLRRTGRMSVNTSRLTVGDLTLDLYSHTVERAGKKIELRPREFTLLEYLMRNAGNVLTKTMIMEKVWNYDFDPQTNIVDVLISRLRTKIDNDFEVKLIRTIRSVGYVLKVN